MRVCHASESEKAHHGPLPCHFICLGGIAFNITIKVMFFFFCERPGCCVSKPALQVFFCFFLLQGMWVYLCIVQCCLTCVFCDSDMEMSYGGVRRVSYNSTSPSSFTAHGAGFTKTSLDGFNVPIV